MVTDGDIENLTCLADMMGFGRSHVALKSILAERVTPIARFQQCVVEMIDNGCVGFHFSVGDKWHSLTLEEKCEAALQMWDAKGRESRS